MYYHIPSSRRRLFVQYLLWGCAVIAAMIGVYIAIQAVLAPWSSAQGDSPLTSLWRFDPSKAEESPTAHQPTEQRLKTDIEQEIRRLDADIRQQKAQEVAAAKARQQAVLDNGQAILRLIDQLQVEIERWDATTAALFANADGRLLAGKREYLEAFDTLYGEDRPTKDTVVTLRRRIQSVLQPVQDALRDEKCAAQPAKEVVALLEEIRPEVLKVQATYRDHFTRLEAILAQARLGAVAGQVSLREAIDQLRRSHAAEKNEVIARAVQGQRKQDAEKMAEVERKRAQQEEELSRTKAEKERLVVLAKDPNLQRVFLPFLQKGLTRIVKHDIYQGYHFGPVRGASEPLSYTGLAKINALTDFEVFLRAATGGSVTTGAFNYSGRSVGRNDRTLWSYPRSEQDWVTCRKNFEVFKQLAPVWAELGLLAP